MAVLVLDRHEADAAASLDGRCQRCTAAGRPREFSWRKRESAMGRVCQTWSRHHAFSASGNSANVTASLDPPSNTGVFRFEHSDYVMDETVRLILHDANNQAETALVQLTTSSGDLENLVLRRNGDTFYGTARMGTDGYQAKFSLARCGHPRRFHERVLCRREYGCYR